MTHNTTKHEARWVILRGGKIQGPFCDAEIMAKLSCKQLDASDALWRPSFTRWQSVTDFVQKLSPQKRQKIYKALQQHERQQAWQQAQLNRQKCLKQARQLAAAAQHSKTKARPPEATGPDAVAARLRRCAVPKLSTP